MEYQDIRRTHDATDNTTEREEETNVEEMEMETIEKEQAMEGASGGAEEDDREEKSVDRGLEEITPSLNRGKSRKKKAEKTQHTTGRNLSKLVDFSNSSSFWILFD